MIDAVTPLRPEPPVRPVSPIRGEAARRPLALRPVPSPEGIPAKRCPDGHPNDPEATDCRLCQFPLESAAAVIDMVPVPLGRLVMEDGTAVELVTNLEIGRSPADGPGDTLTVTGRQVSRRHLAVVVQGWRLSVRDLGSTNGTFISRRNERGRRRVPEERPVSLHIGDTVHFGERQALVAPPTT